jgi:glycerol-3-phosphate dehydrogenase
MLVVGGGIYGAWIAYDATLRGLRVALVEQRDWGAGTSSGSSKLIHGGLRYLESLHLGLVRKTLRERRLLARLGPHRVGPVRFALPVYAGAPVGRLRLRAGLCLYDLLAGPGQPVPRHRGLSRRAMLERYAFLEPRGLRGGFHFGDCRTDDARFTLEIVDGAVEAGAVAVNAARADGLLLRGSEVVGASVRDLVDDATLDVQATVTVNCAGPWVDALLPSGREERATRLSKGVHLVLPALPTEDAFLVQSHADGRVIFLIPWYGRTLLGTTDTDFAGDPSAVAVEPADVDYLLDRADRVLRGAPWGPGDVIGRFAALRALPASDDLSPSDVSREWSMVENQGRLISSIGGKYTSAREDAATAVDRVQAMLGRRVAASPTGTRPFPWAPPGNGSWDRRLQERARRLLLADPVTESLITRHGSRAEIVLDLIEQRPELADPVVADAPFCLAEALHAVTAEMALTLEDVLRRRLPVLLVSPPSDSELRRVADLVGDALGWPDARRAREVASLAPRPARAGGGQP